MFLFLSFLILKQAKDWERQKELVKIEQPRQVYTHLVDTKLVDSCLSRAVIGYLKSRRYFHPPRRNCFLDFAHEFSRQFV